MHKKTFNRYTERRLLELKRFSKYIHKFADLRHANPIKHRKLLLNIFISNIVIALVAATLQFAYSFTISSHFIKDNYVYSSSSKLKQLTDSYDKYLSSIYQLKNLFNPKNDNLAIFPDIYHSDIAALKTWMDNYSSFISNYEFIDSSWIYMDNLILDTSSGPKDQTKFSQWAVLSKLISDGIDNYLYMIPYISQPREKEDSYYKIFSIISPLFPEDKKYERGCIVFNINLNELTKKNISFLDKDSEYFYVYSKQRNEIVMSSPNAPEDFDGKYANTVLSKMDDSNNYSNIKLDGKKYMFISQRSESSPDWVYIFITNNKAYNSALTKVIGSFLLFLMLMIVVELIISWIIALFIYKPFNQITKNLSRFFKEQPHDEISLINSHIVELQNNINEKDNLLNRIMPDMRRSVLSKLFAGRFKSADEAIAVLENYGVSFSQPDYFICLFLVDRFLDFSAEKQMEFADELRSAIDKVCAGSFNYVSSPLREDCTAILINADNELSKSSITRISSQINDILMNTAGTTCTMCISNVITNTDDIVPALSDVLKNSTERFGRFGYGSVIFPDMLYSGDAADDFELDSKIEGMLLYAAAHNSTEKTDLLIERLSKILCGSTEHIVKLYDRIFYLIDKNTDGSIFSTEAYKQSFDKLVKYGTKEEALTLLQTMLKRINSLAGSETPNTSGKKIKQYIDENYSSDLSLQKLSDIFGLSPAYISNTFKTENNIGFIEYVNKIRIEKAKYLLAHSSMPVNLICENVGFTTYTSFARVFKSIVGMSAKEYRCAAKGTDI